MLLKLKDFDLFNFGHLKIDGSQCFYLSAYCYAFVNLMPLLPGRKFYSLFKFILNFLKMY
jgi:hypothetical protein